MTPELARHKAAQAKADEIARTIGEQLNGQPHLVVAVTDPVSGQRLATCFVNVDAPVLHVVGGAQ